MNATEINALFNEHFTPKQIIAIKDAILYGAWGDADTEFRSEDGWTIASGWGFCTNDIYKGNHFESRRSISGIVSGIQKKIQSDSLPFVECYPDYWGDGQADMIFFNVDYLACEYETLVEFANL